MRYETIVCDLRDDVLVVTLSRPHQLNAFTAAMSDELVDVFEQANDADDVRVVVVTGAGRAFCAGMDLRTSGNVFGLDESRHPTLEDVAGRIAEPNMRGVQDLGGRVALAIFDCKKPVIAAINGAAVGVGATMTLPMDIRILADTAGIGFAFGRIGITPDACSTWFLPRLVGVATALEWFYTAEMIPPEEALRTGLVRKVVSAERVVEEALSTARRIVDHHSPVALALTRQMTYRNSALDHPMRAHELESLSVFYTSVADGKEGVQAFTEKRKPRFISKASAMPPFYSDWLNDRPPR